MTLVLAGQYPEGGGTMDVSYRLDIYSLSLMEGTATWDHTGGPAPCTDCVADVVAMRTGPIPVD